MRNLILCLLFLFTSLSAASPWPTPLKVGDALPADFVRWVESNCPDWEEGYFIYVWWPNCGPSRRLLSAGFSDSYYPVVSVCQYYGESELMEGAKEFLADENITTPVFFSGSDEFHYRRAICMLFVRDGVVCLVGVLPDRLPDHPLPPDTMVSVTADATFPTLTSVELPWGDAGNTVFASAEPVTLEITLNCSASRDVDVTVGGKAVVVPASGERFDIPLPECTLNREDGVVLKIEIPEHSVAVYLWPIYDIGDTAILDIIFIKSFTEALGNTIE